MSFEDIPEDKEESYQCEACGVGNLKLNDTKTAFECDTCNAYYELPNEVENDRLRNH